MLTKPVPSNVPSAVRTGNWTARISRRMPSGNSSAVSNTRAPPSPGRLGPGSSSSLICGSDQIFRAASVLTSSLEIVVQRSKHLLTSRYLPSGARRPIILGIWSSNAWVSCWFSCNSDSAVLRAVIFVPVPRYPVKTPFSSNTGMPEIEYQTVAPSDFML